MKKLLLLLCLFTLISTNIFAQIIKIDSIRGIEKNTDYETSQHSYYVEQAHLQLLYKRLISYPKIEEYLHTIKYGSMQEDAKDLVYHYYGVGGENITITHFWNSDLGDDQENAVFDETDVPNSYTKIRKYIHGNWKYPVELYESNGKKHTFQYYDTQWGEYGLINYYKTGHVYCTEDNCWEEHSQETREWFTMLILGHMCHLLCDMTVPAHIHVDEHPLGDCYEVYCDDYGLPNYRTAGLFLDPYYDEETLVDNPIRYLCYSSSQIADYFASTSKDILGGGCGSSEFIGNTTRNIPTYNLLNTYYNNILPPFNQDNINFSEQRYYLANFSIKSTASLLYWFATQADLPGVSIPIIIAGFLPEPPVICGTRGKITCEAYGVPNIRYQWNWENKPDNVQIIQRDIYDNYVEVVWPEAEKTGKTNNSKFSDFKLICTASNDLGSYTKDCYPLHSLFSGIYSFYPSSCETRPTPIIIKDVINPNNISHTFPVTFQFNTTVPTITPDWGYKMFFKYDNGVEIVTKQVAEGRASGTGQSITQNVTINSTNGPCLNKPAELIIKIYAYDDPTYERTISTYFEPIYENDPICNPILKSVNCEAPHGIDGSFLWSNFGYPNSDPCNLPYGTYMVERYKVEKTLNTMFPRPTIENNKCVGYPKYDGTLLNGPMWGGVEYHSGVSNPCLYTYVYHLQGTNIWLPCHKDSAAVVYHTNVSPLISTITQSPIPFTPNNTATFTCKLAPESGLVNSYTWSMINQTNYNITFTQPLPESNKFTIQWNANDKNRNNKQPENTIWITCTAHGLGDNTKTINAFISTNPLSGCPWLVVTNPDTNYNFDNNILHNSQLPGYQGQFITDKYIIKTIPGIFDNKIKFDIVETSIDSTLINSIKLYSVTHPMGTKLGILSDNTIIMYDSASVFQTDRASLFDSLNNYQNITELIKYHNPLPLESSAFGDSLYHIYAEFNKSTPIFNPAIITYMRRGILDPVPVPAPKDNFSGNLFINTPAGTSQYLFMRRENPDDVIIPFTELDQEGSADSIHIAWDKSFNIKYAAIASLNYSGFSVSELPLVTAFHTSDGDVLQNLLYLDSSYSYICPSAYLNLEFSTSPAQFTPTLIKEYVLEINGQVIYLGSNKMRSTKATNPNLNTIPDKYSLSQNYPNPFNPVTKINFALPKQGFVTLKIYDVLGREVRTLVNEVKSAGNYTVDFNGSNLASGIYFYRLESNNFTSIKRMVLIK